jgi:hypothetical protein
MRRSILCFLAVSFLLSIALPAVAGVRLECENWAYDDFGESSVMTILIDGKNIRIEEKDDDEVALFRSDGDGSELFLLKTKDLEYVRIDKDRGKKLYQKIEGIIEQVEGFIQNQPKEQREQFRGRMTPLYRAMLAMEAGREKDKKFKYEKTGEAKTLLELECDSYKGFYKDDLYHEVWFAPFDKLDIEAGDAQALLEIHEAFRGWFSIGFPPVSLRADAGSGALGMPVRVIMYHDDVKTLRFDVHEIHAEDIDATEFEVPSGFDEQDFEEWLATIGQG